MKTFAAAQMRGGVGRDAADIHRGRGLRRSEWLNVMREGVVELEPLPSMLRLRADDPLSPYCLASAITSSD